MEAMQQLYDRSRGALDSKAIYHIAEAAELPMLKWLYEGRRDIVLADEVLP
ncbi:hypothetical protein JG687_00012379 [Phytophthora cactorum]|uniref:Uncharacterized protein n=1 Tax=Phytophthora cactorum TaxID=29920 RepID=A0A8T1U425_9STRA|nr:hypothetical protein JG687_00012379 [Phytophthora cactorum]